MAKIIQLPKVHNIELSPAEVDLIEEVFDDYMDGRPQGERPEAMILWNFFKTLR